MSSDMQVALHHDLLIRIGHRSCAKLLAMTASGQNAAIMQLASLFGKVESVILLQNKNSEGKRRRVEAKIAAADATGSANPSSSAECDDDGFLSFIVSFAMTDVAAGQRAKIAFKAFCDVQNPPHEEAGEGSCWTGWQAAWITDAHNSSFLEKVGLAYCISAQSVPTSAAVGSSGSHAVDELTSILYYLPSTSAAPAVSLLAPSSSAADELLQAMLTAPQAKAAIMTTAIVADRLWVRCVSEDAALHVADHVKKTFPKLPKGHLSLASAFPTGR